ncbi:hypothetical protein [Cellulophaga baltica]|uniref:hypothetical protein n=1 Tax=Cellulophaga baltica TaxID=76594 RepID=UPI002494622C|nr:hypothetical protein [Cellulophaga baltica]
MSIVVKSVKLFSNGEYTPSKNIKEGVFTINNKKHKLFTVPLGTIAKFQPDLYNKSMRLTNERLKKHLKWIMCSINPKTGEKKYKEWETDKETPSFSYDDKQKLSDYADTQVVSIRSSAAAEAGVYFWLEAFMTYPEFENGNQPKGVYILFEDTPHIKYAYFSNKTYYEKIKLKAISQYGKSVNLILKTYKIGDPDLGNNNNNSFKVVIYSKTLDKPVSEELIYKEKSNTNPQNYIDYINLSIFIEPEWRDKVGHKPNSEEEYFAKITPTLILKEATHRTADLDLKEQNLKEKDNINDNLEINNKVVLLTNKNKTNFNYESSKLIKYYAQPFLAPFFEYREIESYTTTHHFNIIYNTDSDFIVERNNKVGQQMASFNDIEHNCIPNEYSCKFTDITITEAGRLKPLLLLEETDNGHVKDFTKKSVGLVVKGETTSKIKIELNNLSHAGTPVECISSGRYHGNTEDVFGLTTDLARLQSLSENDVEITNNTLTLTLKYQYDKVFNSRIKGWINQKNALGKWCYENIDHLWIFNYFLLKEEQAQNYFVPVSTCRYPSQQIKIKAYPQINWAFMFSLSLKEENYKFNFQQKIADEKKALVDSIFEPVKLPELFDRDNPLPGKSPEKLDFKVSLKCSYDSTIIDFTPGVHEKIRNIVQTILKAKGFIDEITGNSISDEEKETIYSDRKKVLEAKFGKKKWFKKLSKLPITISVDNPQIAFVFAWGREIIDDGSSFGAPIAYNAMIQASPLFKITGSLDLITCAGFIPVAGQIIKVVELVLDVIGADPVFKLEATGQIDVSANGKIQFDERGNGGHLETSNKASISLSVEASITLGGGILGFVFSGGDIDSLIKKNTYMIKAEAGFTANFAQGVHFTQGPYFRAQLGFSGIMCTTTTTSSINKLGKTTVKEDPYIIVPKKDPMIGKTFYFND